MGLLFISIVMPLYNKEKEIARAIHSVLSQTFTDFELIVVNDGSTDGSVEVVEDIEDERLRIIHQANRGVSVARNRGVAEANTDLIAFLDADDEWKPDFLETIIRLKKTYTSCSVYATAYLFCRNDGFHYKPIVRLPGKFKEGILRNYFLIASQSDPPLWTSAIAVAKQAIENVGGFPEGITSGEDLLTWARLASKYEIAYSGQECALHYNPLYVSDRPDRRPQDPDTVGRELTKLLMTSNSINIKGLNEYIALWHRMRAVSFMQLGERSKSIKELHKALHYSFGLKAAALYLLSLMPSNIFIIIIKLRKLVNQSRQHR